MTIKAYYQDNFATQYQGHVLDILPQLKAESIQCCISSPPYWGLRDYGLEPQMWDGDKDCEHEWGPFLTEPIHPIARRCDKCGRFGVTTRSIGLKTETICENCGNHQTHSKSDTRPLETFSRKKSEDYPQCLMQPKIKVSHGDYCGKCDMWRGSLGLEPNPELYIQHIVQVFREVWRVLRKDGTCWLNLGSSYASSNMNASQSRLSRHEVSCGSDDKEQSDFQETDPASFRSDDEYPDDFQNHHDHNFHNGQSHRQSSLHSEQKDHDNEQTDSEPAVDHVSLSDVQESTIDEFSQQPLGGYLQKDSPSFSPSNAGSCSDDAHQSSNKEYNNSDKPLPDETSAFHRPDKELSSKAYQSPLNGLISNSLTNMFHDVKFKPKDLIPIPWMVAMALQNDGWWLRSDNIWNKLNPMPESVNGWRWERHQIKIKAGQRPGKGNKTMLEDIELHSLGPKERAVLNAQWQDCPGCPKCTPNDGLILRKGSWRPTRAHEYVFLLTKSDEYFADADAVKEECKQSNPNDPGYRPAKIRGYTNKKSKFTGEEYNTNSWATRVKGYKLPTSGRNLRSVWTIATEPTPETHFATFPEKLVIPCIKAGTSEKGCCPECGAPWVRVVEKIKSYESNAGKAAAKSGIYDLSNSGSPRTDVDRPEHDIRFGPCVQSKTIGWKPSCECGNPKTIPCTVLDCFSGSGKVLLVAKKLFRKAIGIELNATYCEMPVKKLKPGRLSF